MDDLSAFMTARLAEDAKRFRTIWRFKQGDRRIDGWWDLGGTLGYAVNDCADTTRGGREVAAKRAIVAAYVRAKADFGEAAPHAREVSAFDGGILTGHMVGLREAVTMLAAAYESHPDYKPEWRIDA